MTVRSRGQAIYSIGAVARMLLIPVATLRSWEDRYGVIVPERSPGGQRRYSQRQVDQLRFVQARVREGFAPSDAHRLLEDRGSDLAAGRPGGEMLRPLVLLAESDQYGAETARDTLRDEGYEVIIALDAADAEEKFNDLVPDVTVLEWLISGGVGAELIRRMKARSDNPVLVISTLALRDLAPASGAEAFLAKPLDPASFVATVRELLNKSQALRPAPVA